MNSRNSCAKDFQTQLGFLKWKETLEFMIEAWIYLTKVTFISKVNATIRPVRKRRLHLITADARWHQSA